MTSAAWISPGQHIAEHSAPRLSGITAGMERGSVRNRESIPAYPLLYRKRRVLCLLSSIDPVWKTEECDIGKGPPAVSGQLILDIGVVSLSSHKTMPFVVNIHSVWDGQFCPAGVVKWRSYFSKMGRNGSFPVVYRRGGVGALLCSHGSVMGCTF